MLLLRQYNVEYLIISFALVNALVITKVIMIGEYAELGREHEDKSLLISAVWKAFMGPTSPQRQEVYGSSNSQAARSSCSASLFPCLPSGNPSG
jgi:hypothetical protein